MEFPVPNIRQFEHLKNRTFNIPYQRSCAVVGNSGILLNSSYGRLIDQHDLVIRANLQAVKGYERDVGTKMNITSINMVALKSLVKQLNGSAKTTGGRAKHPPYLKRLGYLKDSILWYPLDVTEETRELLKFVSRKCEENGLSVQLAFSPISIRGATRR